MRKLKKNITIISLITLLAIFFSGINVQAAGQPVQLVGESTINSQTQTMKIRLNNDSEVGVVQGYIQGDANIESIQVSPSYNGWTTTYNSATGMFNTFNAIGAKDGDVLEITYKVKNVNQPAKITVNGIELTTLSYDSIQVSEVVGKEVGVQVTPTPTPTPSNSQNTNPTPTPVQTIQANKTDATVNKKPLPQTGVSNTITIVITIVFTVGIISVIRLVVYKNVTKH